MGQLGLVKNKNYKQGYFYPLNREKYIGDYAIYRSGLELKYFRFLDENKKCVKWSSEGVKIPYYWEADGKWHNYYIDLAATFISGDKKEHYLIEIKPFRQTQEPKKTPRKRQKTLLSEQVMYSQNMAKWTSARQFAEKNGFKFIVLTEKDIENS